MPIRRPNQLLAASPSCSDRGAGHPFYYFDEPSTSHSCRSSKESERSCSCACKESLHASKKEIRRLKDALKTLEALAKVAPPPDTSAAWKAEADRLSMELQELQDDRELLLQDLAASRDALSKQISQNAGKVQEAVDRERKVWKQRLSDAEQEAEDLRGQLSEMTNMCETMEQARDRAVQELAEVRRKDALPSCDLATHERVLRDLDNTRGLLAQKESEMQQARVRGESEAAESLARMQQSTNFLERVIKEQKAELSSANNVAAEADAKLIKLKGELKSLGMRLEVLQQENEALLALKKQWEEWMREWEHTARNEARHEEATFHELKDLQQKMKALEDMAEKRAVDTKRSRNMLASKTPTPRTLYKGP